MPKKKKSLKDKGQTPYGGKFEVPIITPEPPMDHEEIAKELSKLSGTKSLAAVDTKTGDVLEYIGRKPGSKGRPSKKSDIVKGPFTVGFEHGAQTNMKPLTFGRDEIERPIWTASGPLQHPGWDKPRRKLRVLADPPPPPPPTKAPAMVPTPKKPGTPPVQEFISSAGAGLGVVGEALGGISGTLGGGKIDDLMALSVAGVIFYRANDTKYVIGTIADWISELRLKPGAADAGDVITLAQLISNPTLWLSMKVYQKAAVIDEYAQEMVEYKKNHADWTTWQKTPAPQLDSKKSYEEFIGHADTSGWSKEQKAFSDKAYQDYLTQYEIDYKAFHRKHTRWMKKHNRPEPMPPDDLPPDAVDPRHSTVDEAIMMAAAAYFVAKNPNSIGQMLRGVGEIVKGIGEIVPL